MTTIKIDCTFVEFSKGEYQGMKYNSVLLSNGTRQLKAKNLSEQDDLLVNLKEGQAVVAEIEYSWGKTGVNPVLRSLVVRK